MTQLLINWLKVYYWIEATALTLLPLGADLNACIYKVEASDRKTYFVKLKRGHDFSISILELLQRAGIQQLIPPVKTAEGKQIQQAGEFTLIVYPFVDGQDGFSRTLTDEQWILLGRALRQVHEIEVPASLQTLIRREDFSPARRDAVRSLYHQIEALVPVDEAAKKLWKFLKDNKPLILQLVERAEQLAQKVRTLKFVLCHSDIHAGNVLVEGKETLYIVDWDDPVMAPKERDLMFIGGGVGNVWNQPREAMLFYQGYGSTEVDKTLLAYYRCERIVVDISEYSQELLFESREERDRPEMLQQFMDMFVPNGVVEIALATDLSI